MSDLEAVFSPLFPADGEVGKTPGGNAVTTHTGSPGVERTALRKDALVVDRSWRALVRLGGEDRRRFLNGLMTCDVQMLGTGDGAYGFFTDSRGRVLADAVVLATEEALLVDVPRSRADRLVEHLTQYIISDRVEPSILPVRSLLLAGPEARARWQAAGGAPVSDVAWAHAEASIDGIAVGVAGERRIGPSALALWVSSADAAGLFERLACKATVGGWTAVNDVRIERGIPWFGIDFSEENIPQETSLATAVSFEKGCYLGQEVVARVHFLGKASRSLHRVKFRAAARPEVGAGLVFEERELGTLTSVTTTDEEGEYLGIASIHRRVTEENFDVKLAGTPVEIKSIDAL